MKQSMNKKSLQRIKKNNSSKNHSTYQPKKLLYFFITLGVIQALIIGTGIISTVWVSQLKGTEAVGGSLVVGLLLGFALIAVAVLALINLIGLPIYIIRRKPRNKWLVYSILSLAISTLPFAYMAILASVMCGNSGC